MPNQPDFLQRQRRALAQAQAIGLGFRHEDHQALKGWPNKRAQPVHIWPIKS